MGDAVDRVTEGSPAPATNAFILTNPSGTDLRRGDQFDLYALRFTTGYRF
jgi:hypothetical protein